MFVKDGRPHAVSNAIAVEGGYRMYAFPHAVQPVIHSFFSPDGVNWQPEEGVRLAMDPTTGFESEGVKDESVARLAGGGYLMVYVTEISEPRAVAAWHLNFRPDAGIRIPGAQLPKPWVAESGEVYLCILRIFRPGAPASCGPCLRTGSYFHRGNRRQTGMATRAGFAFQTGVGACIFTIRERVNCAAPVPKTGFRSPRTQAPVTRLSPTTGERSAFMTTSPTRKGALCSCM